MAQRRAWLDDLALSLDASSVRVSVDMAWDRPLHEGITRKVLRYKPDLVLKDTHHHTALQRALLTNTDWHLIRECPAPLLLVRDTQWTAPPRCWRPSIRLHERDKPAALDGKDSGHGRLLRARSLGGELHVAARLRAARQRRCGGRRLHPLPLPARELNAEDRGRARQRACGACWRRDKLPARIASTCAKAARARSFRPSPPSCRRRSSSWAPFPAAPSAAYSSAAPPRRCSSYCPATS